MKDGRKEHTNGKQKRVFIEVDEEEQQKSHYEQLRRKNSRRSAGSFAVLVHACHLPSQCQCSQSDNDNDLNPLVKNG
jgi:hypothetical protein